LARNGFLCAGCVLLPLRNIGSLAHRRYNICSACETEQ
jgi:hypothetical protein